MDKNQGDMVAYPTVTLTDSAVAELLGLPGGSKLISVARNSMLRETTVTFRPPGEDC